MHNVTEFDLIEMSRESLIEWLCSNDSNGVYRDDECELEGIEKLTKEEALEIALNQIKG